MFGELQKFPEHNMTNQRSHLTAAKGLFWRCDLFFLRLGQSPNLKKNKSHLHSHFFRRRSRRLLSKKITELLFNSSKTNTPSEDFFSLPLVALVYKTLNY
jgi:hypothetical protein